MWTWELSGTQYIGVMMARKFFPNSWNFVDIGIHVVVAVVAVGLLTLVTGLPWLWAGLNVVVWFLRELWQHGWKLKRMGAQSHAEWIAPGIAGFIVVALV